MYSRHSYHNVVKVKIERDIFQETNNPFENTKLILFDEFGKGVEINIFSEIGQLDIPEGEYGNVGE